MIKVSNVLQDV